MTDLRKAAEMALEALEEAASCVQHSYLPDSMGHDWDEQIEALRQALAEPANSTTDFVEPKASSQTEHKDWCASLTQLLACNPPRPAPCNCKPVDAVNISQERVDKTVKREHEPIAFVTGYFGGHLTISCFDTALVLPDGLALYTAPPKREWVGLTDEEISLVDWKLNETLHDYARAIEAKLKEKNGG